MNIRRLKIEPFDKLRARIYRIARGLVGAEVDAGGLRVDIQEAGDFALANGLIQDDRVEDCEEKSPV